MKISLYDLGIIDFYLMYFDFQLKSAAQEQGHGIALKNIPPFDVLKRYLVPIPPIQEQQRIIATVNDLLSKVDSIDADSEAISNLIAQTKSKILDLAIRGQLVPQDPEDEPASVLLERIREEKEELIRQGKIKRDKKESVIFKGEDNSYYEKVGSRAKNIDDQIPFELPDGWTWCRGYSCFDGMESNKPTGDFFDYIDIDAIDNRLHRIKAAKHLPVSEAPSRASRAVHNGSVLFSLVRPYLENIALVEERYSHCIVSTGFYVCNSNGVLLPEFMFFLMISGYVVNGLNQFMKGDNSPSISKEDIESWLYPIPPLDEQKSICVKLNTVFTLLENLEKSLI
jgi:type I restriction enzyme S subunit